MKHTPDSKKPSQTANDGEIGLVYFLLIWQVIPPLLILNLEEIAQSACAGVVMDEKIIARVKSLRDGDTFQKSSPAFLSLFNLGPSQHITRGVLVYADMC